jgi:hypothetical protein
MSTIVTRAGKGSPLTHTEVDNNFTNLNTDKYQSGNNASFGTLTASGAVTFSSTVVMSGSTTANTFSSSGATITGGTINSTAIGGTTAAAGKFTTLEATGVTTVQAGTVSAPAITTSGDTNTGIFFPAADTIAFTEGGVESLRIDSSGNVGIGTSTATDGGVTITTNQTRDGGVNAKLALQSTGSNNYPFLLFSGCSSTTRYGGIIQTTSTSGSTAASNAASIQFPMDSATACHMSFWTNANIGTSNLAERMRIDSSGNLLVGITSARANAGDVQVSKGISFPATQSAQSDANTLDDYEEGTWTPTNTEGITFSGITATYEKIGRTVIARARFIIATNSNANVINIGGLPFSNAAQNSGAGGFFTYNASNVSGSVYVGTTTGTFYKDDGTAMVFSSFSNKDTQFTLVYYVS